MYIKYLKGRREMILTKSVQDITLEHTTSLRESRIKIQHHPEIQGNWLKKVIELSRKGTHIETRIINCMTQDHG